MEQLFKPDKLNLNSNSPTAAQDWDHWYKTFNNFLEVSKVDEDSKLKLITNFVTPSVYAHISECSNFEDAVTILQKLYCKPVNEVFARHKLLTRRQQHCESIDQFLEGLKILSKDCNFKAVSAETNRDDCIRDSFVNGLLSPHIRQRLLENLNLPLKDAYEQARCLEIAQQNASMYQTPATLNNMSSDNKQGQTQCEEAEEHHDLLSPSTTVAAATTPRCIFCGYDRHKRSICPARNSTCKGCGKKGHFIKVCRSTTKVTSHKSDSMTCALSPLAPKNHVASIHPALSKATVPVIINHLHASALIDTGSSASFICDTLVRKLKLKIFPSSIGEVMMASNSLSSQTLGACSVRMKLLGNVYNNVSLSVLPSLCTDVIIGHDLLARHSKLEMYLGGSDSPLAVSCLAAAKVKPASLFSHLTSDCRPISIKSRTHSESDSKFISAEVSNLLKEGVIEPSLSPWRAQALVTSSSSHKRRMVIDYSLTINKFTLLDAYPLPKIEDLVNKVANYSVFSTIDLKSAYHQIPIKEEEKHYTAFEASGRLYQFKRIPFGVTNGVAAFQRVIDEIIQLESLNDTFAYLDDVTICGKTQEEHNQNLEKFMQAVTKYGLTVNKNKSSFSLSTINLLGYTISNGVIKPDVDRLLPLKNLPLPTDTASLRRAVGMFSHFSKFIPRFSERIQPLTKNGFPLSSDAISVFNNLKKEIENASMFPISPDLPFTVETDASDTTIAATLTQDGRPVAFFSRGLNPSELRHSSVEKEAYAIIEAIRKWRHYLLGRHFKLITDQKSVSFMFNSKLAGKIKNEKIMRWRLELSCYSYDIVYRPGRENVAADALTRAGMCSSISEKLGHLRRLHDSLCHPGETRMYHWVRSKNLSYTLEEIRKLTSSCRICSEIKPRYCRIEGKLIKSTAPFERLNVDFKGPLPTSSRNRYILTIVDEYSRFPFAFPCSDLSSETVISKFKQLFALFGTPAYVHSDRGTSFMSQEIKEYLFGNGIATSRTTPYNPQGNGQVERYNGIVWKTVELALKNRNLDITKWEIVLDEALHAIRSLLCTSTNCTPHERMFGHPRRSSNGISAPSWLMKPGPVLMKRHVRQSKYDPLVEDVTLIDGNAEYAFVRLPDGRETTISTRHLAPAPDDDYNPLDNTPEEVTAPRGTEETPPAIQPNQTPQTQTDLPHPQNVQDSNCRYSPPPLCVRQSSRFRRLPAYLSDYNLG